MKTKIAAALSVVGVLGAGSAAAMVNTQILDNGPKDSGASAAVLPTPSSIQLTVPPKLEAETEPTTTMATTTSTVTTEAPTTTAAPEPAASGYLTAFNVGDAGVVTVDVIDGRLLLVEADANPGWSVTKAEDDRYLDVDAGDDHVEVHFTSSTVRVEFEAHFVDGQIVPTVQSKSVGGTTGGGSSTPAPPQAPATTTAPASNSGYHDDDEYEHDDDHEYEYEGGEHEGGERDDD